VGRVSYGETADLGQEIVEDQAARHHAVELTGLQPYTVYHYRVDDGQTYTFRTAPTAEQDTFRFAVLGDTRTNQEPHAAVVAQVVDAAPDLVIHTGDLVGDGWDAAQWDTFFRIEAPLLRTAPFYPAMGNHEKNDPLYFEAFHLPGNERWYAFDYGPARFIILEIDRYAEYGPGSDQMMWLEEELTATDASWVFVAFHIAVYTSRSEEFDEVALRNTLTPLFETYGVDLAFQGHHHSYERIPVDGVTYIVTAGGGAPLYAMEEPEPNSAALASAHHFVLLEVEGDTLTGTAIDRNGTVIDSFELTQDE
jgi:3',5'-cyclic AMP phosphodiesterase CpdA